MTKIKKVMKQLTLFTVLMGISVLSQIAWAQLADGREDDPHSRYLKKVITSRQEKDIEFKTSSTSPMAAVQRLEVETKPGQLVFVEEVMRTVRVSKEDTKNVVFVLKERKGSWAWEAKLQDMVCHSGKKKIESGQEFPSGSLFQGGACNIKVYPLEKSLVFIVFDMQTPQKLRFSKLLYFPVDQKYAVDATLEKFKKIDKVVMGTSQKKQKTYHRYARIKFMLDGKEQQLTAFKYAMEGEGSDMLFIPFGDATNGEGSYEVGRFLDVPEPKTEKFILDFNFSYNPLCNYSHAYNCPIPPLENILKVPIKAGEMEYPHVKH